MGPLVVATVLLCVLSYFVCGIPFGLLVGSIKGDVDVREVGSGNIGTTNVARSVGKGAAALTLLLDALKGLVCVFLARVVLGSVVFGGDWSAIAWGQPADAALGAVFAACVCGHILSPYLHFHGGKGVAVGLGAGLGVCWPATSAALALFIVLAVSTRRVSLGSVAAALAIPVGCVVCGMSPWGTLLVAAGCGLAIWAHRANIRKLVRGQESEFRFHEDEAAGKAPAEASGEGEGAGR